ncbi:MAG: IPT/TIG domain-containing protein [Desulfuromonadaceae bacterium]|nr:IPT/TIG domain-containing protein [Desulfuromonadaceae bacterium]
MLFTSLRALILVFSFCLTCEASVVEQPAYMAAAKPLLGTVPITVLSIIPTQAEPGTKVLLTGTGFGENATVFLGSVEVPAQVTGAKQAEFVIPPQLEPGLYALYLKRADGTVGRSYNFTVLSVRPVLSSLQPSRISSCATGKEREVVARGENFGNTSMLFFNGAVISSTLLSSSSISFTVPSVAGGLYHVQVKNALDNSSIPLTLVIETKPEIGQITVGNDYVNYYELIITGRNFNQNSSIYVDGVQIGGGGGDAQDMTERDKLIFVDCTKLVYQRHPYSPVNKNFRIQVINPGEEGSQVITVTAP